MENISLIFKYKDKEEKLECKKNEYLKDIFQKYSKNINKNIEDIFFSYNDKKINENLKLEELDKSKMEIKIMVYDLLDINQKKIKNLLNIECPECGENCYLEIKNYKLNVMDCEGEHSTNNIFLDKYLEILKLKNSKIICNSCNNNNLFESNEFYKCYSCNINLCPNCKLSHNLEHNIINYSKISNICKEHGELYTDFCKKCNKNLCIICREFHTKGHQLEQIKNLIQKRDYTGDLKELRNNIDLFHVEINNVINMLNKILNNMEIFYKINSDAVDAFENEYYNIHLFKNLNVINEFGKNTIINDIQQAISEKNFLDKIFYIYGIYDKMNTLNEIQVNH